MADSNQQDIAAIEDLRRRDVAASRAGDFEKLKTLMDPECVVLPPDSEPERGQDYLGRMAASSDGSESVEQVDELTQDWEELLLFGDYAYERGIVHYAVKDSDGEIVRESQRLVRILRRQGNGSWRVYRAMWHQPRRC